MLIRLFFFLTTCIYSQYHPNDWGSITSLLTPTGIHIATDGTVYASTSGGLLEFNPITEKFTAIKMEDGLIYLDLSCIEIDNQGRLWLGGAYPNGYLQVYDPIRGLVRKITHLDIAEIKMIRISENTAFAIYEGTTSGNIGILEFELDDVGLPDYKDYYTNFTDAVITEIHDLDIFQDSLLYITTDQGIFVGNAGGNLKSSENWDLVYDDNDAKQYLPFGDDISNGGFVITDSLIFNNQTGDWLEYYDIFNRWPYCEKPDPDGNFIQCPSPNDDSECRNYYYNGEDFTRNLGRCGQDIIQADLIDGSVELLLGQRFLILKNGLEHYSFEIPYSAYEYFRSKFTSFASSKDNRILGMESYGHLSLDVYSDSYQLFSPNTSHTNEFYALVFTSAGDLAAVSKTGVLLAIENKKGRIVDSNGLKYHNALSYPDYKYYPKNHEQNRFFNKRLLYHAGKYPTYNIIEKNNGNLIFGNSYLRHESTWYDFPAVIELDPFTYEFSSYDTTKQIIDGYWGIYSDHLKMNMVINEITEDNQGNIWVTNPFCERYGNLLAIQSVGDDSTWFHVNIPDSSSFRPLTIAFDRSNRAWIGFVYDALDDRTYSNGGIKVFDPSDSSWITIANKIILPGNDPQASVWSLVFDQMDFLWVLNEKGIRGYEYSITENTITLDPILEYDDDTALDLLAHVSYNKGNRIRVDSQNNKWVITHQGVWVIKASLYAVNPYWPSEEGLHPYNSGLLSDIVYDVAFDNDRGLAYLATDKGISILQIPFSDNPSKKQSMYISPNPFIMPDDERVIIKNVPSGSIIKIMTITGTLIKEIQLSSNQSQAIWDGTNDQGEQVGTAVYLVAAHHSSERNKVSKIAVIRK